MLGMSMIKEFKNKRILVTGGTGSIGSGIVNSRDDTKQFELMHEIGTKTPVTFLIGDVRDKERLNMAMENIDIVFHAAALKHVGACEKSPFEAVKTNVQGTQNIVECAYLNNVDKVVVISTDKATDPTNVMGCTKLLAEKLILSSFQYKGNKRTKFSCVRFGNVLGSRGSVIPLFINQIKRGRAITLTDPEMTRFIMSIHQAVQLVFKSTKLMKNREIFVLKMPVVNLGDLSKAVIKIVQDKHNLKKAIQVKIVGKYDGERMHEKLLTEEESRGALELDDMFVILPSLLDPNSGYGSFDRSWYKQGKRAKIGDYSSKDIKKMPISTIKKLLLSSRDLSFD